MNVRFACVMAVALLTSIGGAAQAVTVGGPFGPNGEGGLLNGQTITIGAGGAVFELDAFLNIAGQDLNGGGYGTSAVLSQHPLPAGLNITFGYELQDGDSDLLLHYQLENTTGAVLSDVTFMSFLDTEIDVPINSFFNEFGQTAGTLASGQGYEIDEPGFLFGDIYSNLLDGQLDNSNAVDAAMPEDVAMALSFLVPTLADGEVARIDIMISEDMDYLVSDDGDFRMTHSDSDPQSLSTVTYSGVNPIPEPNAMVVFAIGWTICAGAIRRRA